MISQIGIVTAYVRDQEEALRFYTEKLGFEKRMDQALGPMRWLTVAPPGAETQILLMKPSPQAQGPEGARRAEELIGFGPALVFWADDIESTHRELVSRGVEFVEGPTPQHWGGTQALFKDLYGNTFVLVSTPR